MFIHTKKGGETEGEHNHNYIKFIFSSEMLRVYLNNTEKWEAQVRVTDENGNEI